MQNQQNHENNRTFSQGFAIYIGELKNKNLKHLCLHLIELIDKLQTYTTKCNVFSIPLHALSPCKCMELYLLIPSAAFHSPTSTEKGSSTAPIRRCRRLQPRSRRGWRSHASKKWEETAKSSTNPTMLSWMVPSRSPQDSSRSTSSGIESTIHLCIDNRKLPFPCRPSPREPPNGKSPARKPPDC